MVNNLLLLPSVSSGPSLLIFGIWEELSESSTSSSYFSSIGKWLLELITITYWSILWNKSLLSLNGSIRSSIFGRCHEFSIISPLLVEGLLIFFLTNFPFLLAISAFFLFLLYHLVQYQMNLYFLQLRN